MRNGFLRGRLAHGETVLSGSVGGRGKKRSVFIFGSLPSLLFFKGRF